MSNNTETKKDKVELSELLDFYYQAGDDYQLWDEAENGPYPIDRVFTAFKNFLNQYNHGQHNIQ